MDHLEKKNTDLVSSLNTLYVTSDQLEISLGGFGLRGTASSETNIWWQSKAALFHSENFHLKFVIASKNTFH